MPHTYFGIIDLAEKKNLAPSLEKTLKSLDFGLPFDKKRLLIRNHIGLGSLFSYNTPQSIYEDPPLILNDCMIVSDARLDNRDELASILDISDIGKTSDSEIIYRCYQKFHKDCVNYFVGDYGFLIWNGIEKSLFAASSPTFGKPLYYRLYQSKLYFSTHAKAFDSLLPFPQKPHAKKIAQFICYDLSNPNETFYEDLFCLRPGFSINYQHGRVKREQFYHFKRAKKTLHYPNPEDYFEHFREIFSKSVSCRLKSIYPIASHLSGGLDSSSVSAQAAIAREQLTCYSVMPSLNFKGPSLKNWSNSDRRLIEAFSNMYPTVDVNILTEKMFSLNFDSLAHFTHQYFSFPTRNPCNHLWLTECARQASSKHRTMLIGAMGNFTISWSSRIFTLKTALSIALKNSWFYLKQKGPPSSKKNHPTYLNPVYLQAQSISLPSTMRGVRKFISYERSLCNIFQAYSDSIQYFSDLGHLYNIEHRDPTYDIRLLEFCLSLPQRIYSYQNHQRALVRYGLRNILPPEITNNFLRGTQNPSWHKQLKASSEKIKISLIKSRKDPFLSKLFDLNLLLCDLKDLDYIKWDTLDCLTYQKNEARYRIFLTKAFYILDWLLIRRNNERAVD
jgi:asparagine synthase (glutamine-hydrolysing)